MEPYKISFPQALTFDDVLILPGFADFSRQEIDLSTQLTKNIKIKIPLVSSPMDTVTEKDLAIEIGKLGGIGIIHRNLSIIEQANQVEKVKKNKVLVGAAIGTGERFKDRVRALVRGEVDVIVVDSAHGHSKGVIEATIFIKRTYPKLQVISGNVATFEGAKALINSGADGLRVGMGPGAICTTRIISGMGVPQITAIIETSRAAKKFNVPVIADGGVKYSGDIVKALASGASSVMMGSLFACAAESPGKTIRLKKSETPSRFQSIFNHSQETYLFKEYRGMGSSGAMKKGARIRSEGEFHGKDYKDRVLVAEGVEGLVPIKGKVVDIVNQAIGGIKSGMYYIGAKNIMQLQKKARFIQITSASLKESHSHSVLITNPGENYK